MEKLQGPINPCLIGEDLDVGWLEEFVSNFGGSYRFEDSYTEEGLMPSLEDKRPFLQMLQGAEVAQQTSAATFPFMQEPNYFQLLLRLQHQKMILMEQNHQNYCSNFTSPTELESCMSNITNNSNNYKNDCVTMELQSPVKSETCRSSEEQLHAPVSPQKCTDENQRAETRSERPHLPKTSSSNVEGVTAATGTTREKRKRKRPDKPTKNKAEVESQRMTHIAVERNRRRLMNDHLNALRSLMPPSYVQRGDQASIVGGAIDFVKEMEQLLQSLQAQKRMRQYEENTGDISATSSCSSSPNLINNMFITSPTSPFQFKNFSPNEEGNGNGTEFRRNNNEEFSAENRSALADIKVVMIQNHVNLKIQCQRRPGQLLKAVVAFEELRLTVLHLNITSLHSLVHYTFNLKIEDDCKLGSADEVVRAVHHIFSLINLS